MAFPNRSQFHRSTGPGPWALASPGYPEYPGPWVVLVVVPSPVTATTALDHYVRGLSPRQSHSTPLDRQPTGAVSTYILRHKRTQSSSAVSSSSSSARTVPRRYISVVETGEPRHLLPHQLLLLLLLYVQLALVRINLQQQDVPRIPGTTYSTCHVPYPNKAD